MTFFLCIHFISTRILSTLFFEFQDNWSRGVRDYGKIHTIGILNSKVTLGRPSFLPVIVISTVLLFVSDPEEPVDEDSFINE